MPMKVCLVPSNQLSKNWMLHRLIWVFGGCTFNSMDCDVHLWIDIYHNMCITEKLLKALKVHCFNNLYLRGYIFQSAYFHEIFPV